MAEFTVNNDGSRTRELIKPLTGHAGAIKVINLRPPRYREIMDFGDPSSLIYMNGNSAMPHHDLTIVEKYLVALSGFDGGLVEQLDYRDALALKDAVLDFFKTESLARPSTPAPTP